MRLGSFFFYGPMSTYYAEFQILKKCSIFKTKYVLSSSFGLKVTLNLTLASHSCVTLGKLLNLSVSVPPWVKWR